MKIKQTDVVAEYLHEVDLRLSGLPVLQRRELLADLAAHIATERTERNIQTEGELIEVLERLGSPEVVAAAAYDEAGTRPPLPGARRPALTRRNWITAGIVAGVLVVVLVLCGFFAIAGRTSSVAPKPEQAPATGPVISAPPR
jgi:uncharacterized membrane protein